LSCGIESLCRIKGFPITTDLSIIIVNWNSKDYLRKCIASILANTHGIELEIIVIDSASFDGCGEMLQEYYPQVCFIQSDKNLGFAKANNKAYQVSKGQSLLFLNPDTELVNCGINRLYNKLHSLPHAGIVGAKLLNSDRTTQTSCIQSFPNIMNQVFDAEVLRKCFPRWGLWGMAPLFDQGNTPVEVEAVSGACLMIIKSVFEKVGMFCEDFFMYSEDIDLSYMVGQAGYKTYYVPDAVVIHHGGASSSKRSINTFSDVMLLESQWHFFRKTRPAWYCHLYCMAMFSVSLLRITLLAFIWPVFKMRGIGPLAEVALKKWTARLRWTLNCYSSHHEFPQRI
jgi:N-acetylglucosaminyl-diphospho-decaprenol L-rhamnosyltransferase